LQLFEFKNHLIAGVIPGGPGFLDILRLNFPLRLMSPSVACHFFLWRAVPLYVPLDGLDNFVFERPRPLFLGFLVGVRPLDGFDGASCWNALFTMIYFVRKFGDDNNTIFVSGFQSIAKLYPSMSCPRTLRT
jgi:hypothetical protein